jgi:hypothetical protein
VAVDLLLLFNFFLKQETSRVEDADDDDDDAIADGSCWLYL